MKRLLLESQMLVDRLPDWQPLLIGFVLALVLRLGVAVMLPADFLADTMTDTQQYHQIATNLLDYGVFGIKPGIPDQYVPPGYPAFVALTYTIFGRGLAGVRVMQSLMGALMVVPVFYLSRSICPDNRWLALLAMSAVAVHLVLVFWSSFQLTETLYTLLSLVFILILSRSLEGLQPRLGLATGLMLGVVLLVREVLLPFVVVIMMLAWLRRQPWRKTVTYFLAFGVGVSLVVGTWTVRNVLSTDRFVLITGRAQAAGNVAVGSDNETPEFQNWTDPRRERSAVDAARYALFRDMLDPQAFLSDPPQYFWTLAVRFEFTWLHPKGLESLPVGIPRTLYRIAHILVLTLALLGVLEAIYQHRWRAWLLILIWAYTILVHLFLTTSVPRYSIPVLPIILIFAVLGFLKLLDRFLPLPEEAHAVV